MHAYAPPMHGIERYGHGSMLSPAWPRTQAKVMDAHIARIDDPLLLTEDTHHTGLVGLTLPINRPSLRSRRTLVRLVMYVRCESQRALIGPACATPPCRHAPLPGKGNRDDHGTLSRAPATRNEPYFGGTNAYCTQICAVSQQPGVNSGFSPVLGLMATRRVGGRLCKMLLPLTKRAVFALSSRTNA
jgi:hypothetical protein